jgi:hypothetical protein
MIQIISNGSKWADDPPDEIETLLKRLEEYTLDPTFERYGNFIFSPETGDDWTLEFFGNFFDFSHVFSIITNETEIIEKLTTAIRKNQASEKYRLAKIKTDEHDAERRKRRGY